ncbi:fibrinogen-like protein A [Anopheles darlingi]|uniref:fibrinogen-like protein A n=1 Tax=Anopheles darlingi TaxID=43151 RepID=UPI0021001D6E|nr:fibrinogen-like protein A [Anopheles darlingi]
MGVGLQFLLMKFDTVSRQLQRMEGKLQSVEDNVKSVKDNLQRVEDQMQNSEIKMLQIENNILEHRSRQEKSEKEMIVALHTLENQLAVNLSGLHDNILDYRSSQDKNYKEMFAVIEKIEHQIALNLTEATQQPPFSSRKDIPSKVSGTYLIRVKNDSEPFKVYCEQKAFGGGWIVFQYRYDGSLDFYRGWDEFRDGFGDLNKEFWLGLEKVHQITRDRKHELIVELQDFSGNYKYARYDAFEIGSESERYNLKVLGKYNGTAGDAMSYSMGRKFSTKDRDNDAWNTIHCAQIYEGAWWHSDCTLANLNGRYTNAINDKSMHWYYFKSNWQGLKYSRAMIRELD